MLRKELQAQVISNEKHRTKSSQGTAKGHGEALARLRLSPNPRTDSTHQLCFRIAMDSGAVHFPFLQGKLQPSSRMLGVWLGDNLSLPFSCFHIERNCPQGALS